MIEWIKLKCFNTINAAKVLYYSLKAVARILRRVRETWGDLLSLKFQWMTISWRWCEKNYNNNNNNNNNSNNNDNNDKTERMWKEGLVPRPC